MRQLSQTGQQLVDDIANRHGFGPDATLGMLEALIRGNGSQAQFSHPEFSGSGQWMRGGMTMVSDMFNQPLKSRVDALCSDLSDLVRSQPDWLRGSGSGSGSFQSQSQGDGSGAGHPQSGGYADAPVADAVRGDLFAPPAPGTSDDWWPADLRWPNSVGAQNGMRYAYFAQARRLAVDTGGAVVVYDTLDHRIGGFSQQQSRGGTLRFDSQHGPVDLATLPVVSGDGQASAATGTNERRQPDTGIDTDTGARDDGHPATDRQDVFSSIEKLADLRAKGILSEDEFVAKKAELLARV